MRRRGVAAIAGILAIVLIAFCAEASEPPPPATPQGILSFADSLLATGESFRAATEFMRFLHHYPDDPLAPKALQGLGSAYAQAGRWGDAAETFRRLLEVTHTGEARRLLGAALYRGGHYGEAASVLLSPDTGTAGATLGTLALLRMGQPARLPPGARPDLVKAFSALPRKSPALAGALSAVLPGAGHLYTDRPRDALMSFLLNGSFLFATYEAARREEWALAGVLGFFEAGWYSGNVVSSLNAAYKWNRREQNRFFERWEGGTLPSWTLSVAPGGLQLVASWRW